MIQTFFILVIFWTNLCSGQHFHNFQQRPASLLDNFVPSNRRQLYFNNQNYNQQQVQHPLNDGHQYNQNRFPVYNNQDEPQPLLLPPPIPQIGSQSLNAQQPPQQPQSQQSESYLAFQQHQQQQQQQQIPAGHNYRFAPTVIEPKIPDLLFTQNQNKQLFDYFDQQKRLNELRQKQQLIEEQQQLLEKQYENTVQKVYQNSSPNLLFSQYSTNATNNNIVAGPRQENFYHVTSQQSIQPPAQLHQGQPPQPLPVVNHPPSTSTSTSTSTTTTTTTTSTTTEKPTTQVQVQNQQTFFLPTVTPNENKSPSIQSVEQLNFLEKQYEQNLLNKDDLLQQIKLAIEKTGDANKNFTTREISLASGQKVQVIQTSDPEVIRKAAENPNAIIETSTKPATQVIEELTKNIIPPGVNFELLKPTDNGKFEPVGASNLSMMNLINQQKKVTFVLLEEQDDGTVKVQGIKGNGLTNLNNTYNDTADGDKITTGSEIESILEKLKNGQIQLPTSKVHKKAISTAGDSNSYFKKKPHKISSSIKLNEDPKHVDNTFDQNYGAKKTTPVGKTYYSTTPNAKKHYPNPTTSRSVEIEEPKETFPATSNLQDSLYYESNSHIKATTAPTLRKTASPNSKLIEILKKNELYAMAKYLKQSGLDEILNETGPFTIFVPNDKAFRSLMIQLGGPEKAEEKFKENPRLLSGLLLHHIIPSAFEISSLQDEMTGVSLAGTQLRVNQYTMKDNEWNDIQITTINGAKVIEDKKDIEIPQGIAQTIDRVMFPLPVGDLLQTLQSDREKRFSNFTAAIITADLSDTLQGQKTYTVFAPMDVSFESLTDEELSRIVKDKEMAREFVLSYTVPGAMYTSGMQYYQVRDTMLSEKSVTLIKNSGRVKVNNHSIFIPNIPATNGVIHALDNLL